MQYLKKEVNDEVYFWHAGKRRSLLQVDTINFGCVQPGMPKVPKKRSLHIFAISPEKLIVSLWVSLARHAQNTQNNKFTKFF